MLFRSDYITDIHEELFDNGVDIEFEFKCKDLAIQKFENDYKNKKVVDKKQ